MLIVTGMVATMLVGCGSKAEEAPAEVVVKTEIETDTPAETEVKEEIVEVPVELPFAEANGFTFGTIEDLEALQAHAFLYCADEDNNPVYEPYGVFPANPVITYTYSGIEVTEPDEDGFVDYTVYFDCEFPIDFDYWEDAEQVSFRWMWSNPSPMDYYTGVIFPSRTLFDDDSFEASATVEWDGKSYDVSKTIESDLEYGESEYYETETGMHYSDYCYSKHTIRIHAPAEYDGVVLYMEKGGLTEERFKKLAEKGFGASDEIENFGQDKDDVAAYAQSCLMIRLSDLLAAQE